MQVDTPRPSARGSVMWYASHVIPPPMYSARMFAPRACNHQKSLVGVCPVLCHAASLLLCELHAPHFLEQPAECCDKELTDNKGVDRDSQEAKTRGNELCHFSHITAMCCSFTEGESFPASCPTRLSACVHYIGSVNPAHLGVLQGLHDQNAGALAHDKAVAVLVPRPRCLLRLACQPSR